ncbi:DUF6950 family protein [Sphingomonas abietis]|uniref:DUF6950 domain-containing protein n=1 Tax=Sphingomonas abietis TaxID=3012344 RepID=A0ABY7NU13_9SPHN|nr:hypothetical protein [Sphingomonas abietis]WBO23926.1 hypothetical protein PBT88_07405 [Sphingomonas abietis]
MDHHLIVRRDAAQATLDAYMERPFAWGTGDCGQMALDHLAQFTKLATPIAAVRAKLGAYNTAIGARRAIGRLGFASLAEQLDALGLEQIAPASAWVGDIVAGPSVGAMDALTVYLGNGVVVGFVEESPHGTHFRLLNPVAAWRVPA